MRVAFTSPICIHLQQRCLDHGLHLHETHVLSIQNCSLGYNGNMLLSAVLEVLGQAVHKSTQECIFFFFFCIMLLTCHVALAKLLNLAQTLLFPL